MQRTVKLALALMLILTVIYFGAVVYVNATSNEDIKSEIEFYAVRHEASGNETVHTPEELGIEFGEPLEHEDGYWLNVTDPQWLLQLVQSEDEVLVSYRNEVYRVYHSISDSLYMPSPPPVLIPVSIGLATLGIGIFFLRRKAK